MAQLRKENANFPKELEKALTAQEKEITEKLASRFDFERQLAEKHNEGLLNLKDQTIKAMQAKIDEMNVFVKELNQKANLAESNVKDIAIKAIENSSKMAFFPKESHKQE